MEILRLLIWVVLNLRGLGTQEYGNYYYDQAFQVYEKIYRVEYHVEQLDQLQKDVLTVETAIRQEIQKQTLSASVISDYQISELSRSVDLIKRVVHGSKQKLQEEKKYEVKKCEIKLTELFSSLNGFLHFVTIPEKIETPSTTEKIILRQNQFGPSEPKVNKREITTPVSDIVRRLNEADKMTDKNKRQEELNKIIIEILELDESQINAIGIYISFDTYSKRFQKLTLYEKRTALISHLVNKYNIQNNYLRPRNDVTNDNKVTNDNEMTSNNDEDMTTFRPDDTTNKHYDANNDNEMTSDNDEDITTFRTDDTLNNNYDAGNSYDNNDNNDNNVNNLNNEDDIDNSKDNDNSNDNDHTDTSSDKDDILVIHDDHAIVNVNNDNENIINLNTRPSTFDIRPTESTPVQMTQFEIPKQIINLHSSIESNLNIDKKRKGTFEENMIDQKRMKISKRSGVDAIKDTLEESHKVKGMIDIFGNYALSLYNQLATPNSISLASVCQNFHVAEIFLESNIIFALNGKTFASRLTAIPICVDDLCYKLSNGEIVYQLEDNSYCYSMQKVKQYQICTNRNKNLPKCMYSLPSDNCKFSTQLRQANIYLNDKSAILITKDNEIIQNISKEKRQIQEFDLSGRKSLAFGGDENKLHYVHSKEVIEKNFKGENLITKISEKIYTTNIITYVTVGFSLLVGVPSVIRIIMDCVRYNSYSRTNSIEMQPIPTKRVVRVKDG